MISIYKYVCPKCKHEEESEEFEAHPKYRCSCGFTVVGRRDFSGKYSCACCGDLMSPWDYNCPICKTPMLKVLQFPIYPNRRIIFCRNTWYYTDSSMGIKQKVKECEEDSLGLFHAYIETNGTSLCGLFSDDGYMILPFKYKYINIDKYGIIQVVSFTKKLKEEPLNEQRYHNFHCNYIDPFGNFLYLGDSDEYGALVTTLKGFNIDYWNGDFAVFTKEGKQGILYKDGSIVVNPIFERIQDSNSWMHYLEATKSDSILGLLTFKIYPGTFGEDWVGVEEISVDNKLMYFMDKYGNKRLVFDQLWKDKNSELSRFSLENNYSAHFINGILRVNALHDPYFGAIYKIYKDGSSEFEGTESYGEDPAFKNADDYINYTGYESMGYFETDSYERDAFDDDSEARWNIE